MTVHYMSKAYIRNKCHLKHVSEVKVMDGFKTFLNCNIFKGTQVVH